MKDDSFVDEFSEIVLDSSRDGALRKETFKHVLALLYIDPPTASPTVRPTMPPSEVPTDNPTPSPTNSTVEKPAPSFGFENVKPTPAAQPVDETDSVEQNPGTVSNVNPQPPSPTRPRPVSIDLSAPSNILPSNTIISGGSTYLVCSSGQVWTWVVLSCSILYLLQLL